MPSTTTVAPLFLTQKRSPGFAGDEGFPACRAEEGDVSDDDIVFCAEGGFSRRINDDLAAGKALADVVIRIALQGERQALRDEGAEALSRRADEGEGYGVFGQSFIAVAAGDLAAKDGAGDTVGVLDEELCDNALLLIESRLAHADELGHIEGLFDLMILCLHEMVTDSDVCIRTEEQGIEREGIPAFLLPVKLFCFRRSLRPTMSSSLWKPRCAMISRRSSATKRM